MPQTRQGTFQLLAGDLEVFDIGDYLRYLWYRRSRCQSLDNRLANTFNEKVIEGLGGYEYHTSPYNQIVSDGTLPKSSSMSR